MLKPETGDIYPFTIICVGQHWYTVKPSGEAINVAFNTSTQAINLAADLRKLYNPWQQG